MHPCLPLADTLRIVVFTFQRHLAYSVGSLLTFFLCLVSCMSFNILYHRERIASETACGKSCYGLNMTDISVSGPVPCKVTSSKSGGQVCQRCAELCCGGRFALGHRHRIPRVCVFLLLGLNPLLSAQKTPEAQVVSQKHVSYQY